MMYLHYVTALLQVVSTLVLCHFTIMKCIKGCLEIIVATGLVVVVKLQESSYACEFLFHKELSSVSMNMGGHFEHCM
jgi:hypothetical protein